MKKYLLVLFAAIAIIGCQKDEQAVTESGVRDALESGLSTYNVTAIIVNTASGVRLMSAYKELIVSLDLSLNESGLSIIAVENGLNSEDIDLVYFYSYSHMLQVFFKEELRSPGDSWLYLTLDAGK